MGALQQHRSVGACCVGVITSLQCWKVNQVFEKGKKNTKTNAEIMLSEALKPPKSKDKPKGSER